MTSTPPNSLAEARSRILELEAQLEERNRFLRDLAEHYDIHAVGHDGGLTAAMIFQGEARRFLPPSTFRDGEDLDQ